MTPCCYWLCSVHVTTAHNLDISKLFSLSDVMHVPYDTEEYSFTLPFPYHLKTETGIHTNVAVSNAGTKLFQIVWFEYTNNGRSLDTALSAVRHMPVSI